MALKLNVFIGGPASKMHDWIVRVANTDETLRKRSIITAQAYDDSYPRDASSDDQAWLEWLRSCDVAIFYLPGTASGSQRSDRRYYTEVEAELAYKSGMYVRYLVEPGAETPLRNSLKQYMKTFYPIPKQWWRRSPSRAAIRKALLAELHGAIDHWISQTEAWRHEARRLADRSKAFGRAFDAETEAAKIGILPEHDPGRALGEFIAACYSFRRAKPEDSDVPRYLLSAYASVVQPPQPPFMRQGLAGSPETIWQVLATVTSGTNASAGLIPIAAAASESFLCFPDWRQIALVKLMREISVGFRLRLDLEADWRCCEFALTLYHLRGRNIDPKQALLFDLAIAAVPSAAQIGAVDALEKDIGKSALKVLEEQPSNAGALLSLSMYQMARGNEDVGRSMLETAIKVQTNPKATLHARILFAVASVNEQRRNLVTGCLSDAKAAKEKGEFEIDPIYTELLDVAEKETVVDWSQTFGKLSDRSRRRFQSASTL